MFPVAQNKKKTFQEIRMQALTNGLHVSTKSLVLMAAIGVELQVQRSIYRAVDGFVEFGLSTVRTDQRP